MTNFRVKVIKNSNAVNICAIKYCSADFEIRKLQPIDIRFEKINNEYLLNIYIFPNLV